MLGAIPVGGIMQQKITRMRFIGAKSLLNNTMILAAVEMKGLVDKMRVVILEEINALPGGAITAGNIADNTDRR